MRDGIIKQKRVWQTQRWLTEGWYENKVWLTRSNEKFVGQGMQEDKMDAEFV